MELRPNLLKSKNQLEWKLKKSSKEQRNIESEQSLTWTLWSFTAKGMISEPKSLHDRYFRVKSFSRTSVLNTYTPIDAI